MTVFNTAVKFATACAAGSFVIAATMALADDNRAVVFSPFGHTTPVFLPRASMVFDWSNKHVIFPDNPSSEVNDRIRDDPRLRAQNLRRFARQFQPDSNGNNGNGRGGGNNGNGNGNGNGGDGSGDDGATSIVRDWNVPLGSGVGGTISGPAKFVFDVNAPPSCINDYVVTGLNIAGSATQANLIGFTQLYRAAGGGGLCGGTAPNYQPDVKFAYNIGTGLVRSYVALSLNGQKVAFIENPPSGGATFHVLTIGTTGGNGTSATTPVTPGSGNNAVDTKIVLNPASQALTAPFIDYQNDTAYVTASDGRMHKITGVFNGTPTQLNGSGGWPVATGLGAISTPVYDGVSKRVFFTTSTATLRYVQDGPTASLNATSWTFATATITAAPVMVDSVNQRVYAFATNPSGANPVVAQADTTLSAGSRRTATLGPKLVGTGNPTRAGDFNEAYYQCASTTCANARLYVVGTRTSGANTVPALYAVGFVAGSFPNMNTTANASPVALTTSATGIGASHVTAFYNPNANAGAGRQYVFVGVENACTAGPDAPATPTGGCIRSIDMGSLATPTFPVAGTGANGIDRVVFRALGGTGIITVDNVSTSSGASSVYYTTLAASPNNLIVKATQAGLQ